MQNLKKPAIEALKASSRIIDFTLGEVSFSQSKPSFVFLAQLTYLKHLFLTNKLRYLISIRGIDCRILSRLAILVFIVEY